MAKKRMFRLDVLETDAFMEMPLSTQALYFHLNLRADDDGFVGNPKMITRNVGATVDDLNVLIAKRFLLTFEDGVIVIKHWRLHNSLSQNRYQETKYLEDKAELLIKYNGSYSFSSGKPIDDTHYIEAGKRQTVQRRVLDEPKTSLDKNRKEEISIEEVRIEEPKRFQKPTLEEVKAYCLERGNTVDPDRWFSYYEANGWKVGKEKMKNWKAAVRYWETKEKKAQSFEEMFK